MIEPFSLQVEKPHSKVTLLKFMHQPISLLAFEKLKEADENVSLCKSDAIGFLIKKGARLAPKTNTL